MDYVIVNEINNNRMLRRDPCFFANWCMYNFFFTTQIIDPGIYFITTNPDNGTCNHPLEELDFLIIEQVCEIILAFVFQNFFQSLLSLMYL